MTQTDLTQVTLRQARELKGWTLDGLAERSGVSRAQIMRLESGSCEPLHSTVLKLEDVLGLRRGSLTFPAVA